MTDRELMQQALEALELLAWYENPATSVQVRKPRNGGPIVTVYPHKVATEAAAPLRERLAQPEQDVWQWEEIYKDNVLVERRMKRRPDCGWEPWHTPRREWVGLTEEEVVQTLGNVRERLDGNVFGGFARAIEAKLKEKNA